MRTKFEISRLRLGGMPVIFTFPMLFEWESTGKHWKCKSDMFTTTLRCGYPNEEDIISKLEYNYERYVMARDDELAEDALEFKYNFYRNVMAHKPYLEGFLSKR